MGISKNGRYAAAKFINSKCPIFGLKTDKLITKKLSQPDPLGPGCYEADNARA